MIEDAIFDSSNSDTMTCYLLISSRCSFINRKVCSDTMLVYQFSQKLKLLGGGSIIVLYFNTIIFREGGLEVLLSHPFGCFYQLMTFD